MTREQAITLADSKFWEGMTYERRAIFQLTEKRLCMPFGVFHEAVEKALGRPVCIHEFALNSAGLLGELMGARKPPTFEEVMDMVPKDKRVLIVVEGENGNPAKS